MSRLDNKASRFFSCYGLNWPIRIGVVLLVGALLLTPEVYAQNIKVEASVNDNTVGTEEVLQYTIQIQGASLNDVTTPQPPETEGLALLQSIPSTQRNISFVNGRMEQSIGYTWSFRPVRQGNARIQAASLSIKGKTYQTTPIRIQVVPQAQRPQRRAQQRYQSPFSSSPFRRPSRNNNTTAEPSPTVSERDVFIRVIPSAREAFQNEQVTIEYQLFFRDGIQLRQSRLADSWDAEGFWREELDVETRPIPRSTVQNGLRYNMITLKKAAIFPTHAGELTVDPLRIEAEALVPRRSSDPFEQFFSLRNRYQPVELSSAAVRVKSKPLPTNAPATFTGSVGAFDVSAEVDRNEIEVGESIQVKLTVTGTGNLATLEAPPFAPPGIFEQYEPDVSTSVSRGGNRIRGSKTFTYLLVARSNGTFDIPPFEFTYLEPSSGRFLTKRTEVLPITVTGTAPTTIAATATGSGFPVDDIAGVLTSTASWTRLAQTPLHQRTWPYLALLFPLLTLAGVYTYRQYANRLATDVKFARSRRAHPVAKKHLKQAEALREQNRPGEFYAEVERAVMSFVGNRLNIAETGMTRTQLDSLLIQAGIVEDLRDELRTLLDECDQARFAPVPPDQDMMNSACDRAADFIVRFNESLKQRSTVAA